MSRALGGGATLAVPGAASPESLVASPGVVDDTAMTERTAAQPLPCGTWPSPITAADVARHYRAVSFPVTKDGEVWWQEILPGEQGRSTVVHLGADGKPSQLLPAPWNARTRVHEYGGRAYLPVRAGKPGSRPARQQGWSAR